MNTEKEVAQTPENRMTAFQASEFGKQLLRTDLKNKEAQHFLQNKEAFEELVKFMKAKAVTVPETQTPEIAFQQQEAAPDAENQDTPPIAAAELVVDGVKYHRHPNGGGLVTETAFVAPTAFVGPFALVKDKARVLNNAQILDRAIIEEHAVVNGEARVYGEARVFGDAQVYGGARVYGSTRVYGLARIKKGLLKKGEKK